MNSLIRLVELNSKVLENNGTPCVVGVMLVVKTELIKEINFSFCIFFGKLEKLSKFWNIPVISNEMWDIHLLPVISNEMKDTH